VPPHPADDGSAPWFFNVAGGRFAGWRSRLPGFLYGHAPRDAIRLRRAIALAYRGLKTGCRPLA
jgi:hypothetical protein